MKIDLLYKNFGTLPDPPSTPFVQGMCKKSLFFSFQF